MSTRKLTLDLDRKDVRHRYHRIDKDPGNHGRVFVHFRWRRGQ